MSKVNVIDQVEQKFSSFALFSCHLAQKSIIKRSCKLYMNQVCMSKDKVMGKGQMHNLLLVHNFYILCWMLIAQVRYRGIIMTMVQRPSHFQRDI